MPEKKIMVFHAPYPLEKNAASGSRLRPTAMRDAFLNNGYEVYEITGNTAERATAFRQLKKEIKAGKKIEFVYGENSTQPNLLATSIKKKPAPFLEARIFSYFHRQQIPVGIFYRDIYWKFPATLAEISIWKRLLMKMLYRFDLFAMRLAKVHLFLPSAEMASYVPHPSNFITPLPPGVIIKNCSSVSDISIFYVGSLSGHHKIFAAVEALSKCSKARLTLCVPLAHWRAYEHEFLPYLNERIKIVHGSAQELEPYYAEASLGLLFMEPNEYRRFAVPIKLYEYLGYGKPIIASEGTLAGEVVREKGIGFTIPYKEENLVALLEDLAANPQKLADVTERVQKVREEETWEARAKSAAAVLEK